MKVTKNKTAQYRNRINTQFAIECFRPILSAVEYLFEKEIAEVELDCIWDAIKPRYLTVAMPILIIDGPLYDFWCKDGQEYFNEVSGIPVRFSFAPNERPETPGSIVHRLVYVCKLDGLHSLISSTNRWLQDHGEARMKQIEKNFSYILRKSEAKGE